MTQPDEKPPERKIGFCDLCRTEGLVHRLPIGWFCGNCHIYAKTVRNIRCPVCQTMLNNRTMAGHTERVCELIWQRNGGRRKSSVAQG